MRKDSVAWFVDEVLERTGERGSFVPVRVLWRLFRRVCGDERKPCSQRGFVRKLKELGFKFGPRKMFGEGMRKNVWCCLGVKVKEEYEEEYGEVMFVLEIAEAAKRRWQEGVGVLISKDRERVWAATVCDYLYSRYEWFLTCKIEDGEKRKSYNLFASRLKRLINDIWKFEFGENYPKFTI